jgi:microcystin-dependent protein
MSDPFVAEIRMVGFNFPPTGWAECNGQLLPISQNTALFSLLGTMYGGDGKSTFALPDMQGAVPVQAGQGQGLSTRFEGEMGGSETVSLLTSEMPFHTHSAQASSLTAPSGSAAGNVPARPRRNTAVYQTTTNANLTQMHDQAIGIAGASLPHNNLMPYLVVKFVIAMQGVFPPRA